jgi:hypothetical protein
MGYWKWMGFNVGSWGLDGNLVRYEWAFHHEHGVWQDMGRQWTHEDHQDWDRGINRMYRFDHIFFSGFQQQCVAEFLDLVPLTKLLSEHLENQLPFWWLSIPFSNASGLYQQGFGHHKRISSTNRVNKGLKDTNTSIMGWMAHLELS